jgi:hypothetical protein
MDLGERYFINCSILPILNAQNNASDVLDSY